MRAKLIAIASLSFLLSCGGGDDDAGDMQCLDPLPECTKTAFPPTFDDIFDHVLITSCGKSSFGTSCHYGPTDDEAQAGLVLSDPDAAYDHLLGKGDYPARVIPNDPECSLLIKRIESKDPSYRMPVGGQLTDGERCAIRKWIEQGAKRK